MRWREAIMSEPKGTHVFEATSLTKKFDDTVALKSVTLALEAHRVIGLVGRNGGGKTTLIRHMIGLYLPTEGTCKTLGQTCDQLGANELSRIGVVTPGKSIFRMDDRQTTSALRVLVLRNLGPRPRSASAARTRIGNIHARGQPVFG